MSSATGSFEDRRIWAIPGNSWASVTDTRCGKMSTLSTLSGLIPPPIDTVHTLLSFPFSKGVGFCPMTGLERLTMLTMSTLGEADGPKNSCTRLPSPCTSSGDFFSKWYLGRRLSLRFSRRKIPPRLRPTNRRNSFPKIVWPGRSWRSIHGKSLSTPFPSAISLIPLLSTIFAPSFAWQDSNSSVIWAVSSSPPKLADFLWVAQGSPSPDACIMPPTTLVHSG